MEIEALLNLGTKLGRDYFISAWLYFMTWILFLASVSLLSYLDRQTLEEKMMNSDKRFAHL